MLARTAAGGLLLLVVSAVAGSPAVLRAGVDEGVARYVPWSGSYWPIREGALIRGPLAKYDRITGRAAARWEFDTNPPLGNVPDWYGYCHAWSAAAVMDYEPARPQRARGLDGSPVELGIADQKGMLTACHTDDVAQHYGVRNDGQPEDDPQDIYPDQLWRVLRMYIQQRGVPIILDVEGGTQIWNFPVYAYRVVYRPTGAGNQYLGEMTLWMADDAVPPDIVGVQVNKQTYYFRFEVRDGAALLGTGRWVEPSVNNHPDFAWFPYVVRAENPEVEYDRVRQILGFPAEDASPLPGDSLPGPDDHEPAAPPRQPPSGTALPPGVLPGSSNDPNIATLPLSERPLNPLVLNVPPNVVPGEAERTWQPAPGLGLREGRPLPPTEPWLLSPMELLSLIVNQSSDFDLDVTVDKFDGGHYDQGESLRVRGTSARDGHLYLFYLDSAGTLRLLYPRPGEPNRVRADRRFELPARETGRAFHAAGPPGTHRIKAVVTTRPLLFTGLVPGDTGARHETPQAAGFRLPPSQTEMFRRQLLDHLQGRKLRRKALDHASPSQFLGEFAQDETAFYVRSPFPPDR